MSGLQLDRLIDILAVLSWSVTTLYFFRAFGESLRKEGIIDTLTIRRARSFVSMRFFFSLMTSIAITLIAMAIVFIPPEENAVVLSAVSPGGLRPNPLRSGLHGVIPFVERPLHYPIYNQTFHISRTGFEMGTPDVEDTIASRSSDGQEVFMDASLIFRVDPNRLNEVHIAWQGRYIEDLIRPLVRSAVRATASQLKAEEIYSSERFELSDATFEGISRVLEANGFIGVEFFLRNITFNEEYAHAVEQKVITVQQSERAALAVVLKENEADQIRALARGEADAVLIKAQADAEAFRLVSEVLADNPKILDYEYIKRLSPNVELMLLNSNNPVILPLTTGSATTQTVGANPLLPQMPPSGLESPSDQAAQQPASPTQEGATAETNRP